MNDHIVRLTRNLQIWRRMAVLAIVVLAASFFFGAAEGESKDGPLIAREIHLVDKAGRVTAVLSGGDSTFLDSRKISASVRSAAIVMLDIDGRQLLSIGGDQINQRGHVELNADGQSMVTLQASKKGGGSLILEGCDNPAAPEIEQEMNKEVARLKASGADPDAVIQAIFAGTAKMSRSRIVLDGEASSITLLDERGNDRAILGGCNLTDRKGAPVVRPPASLVFFAPDNRVVYAVPEPSASKHEQSK